MWALQGVRRAKSCVSLRGVCDVYGNVYAAVLVALCTAGGGGSDRLGSSTPGVASCPLPLCRRRAALCAAAFVCPRPLLFEFCHCGDCCDAVRCVADCGACVSRAVCHVVRRRGTSECGDGAQLWRRRCVYMWCPVMQWWWCGPCRWWTLRCHWASPRALLLPLLPLLLQCLMSLSPARRSIVGSSARACFCVISVILCCVFGWCCVR
jgi:hypothetical protein